MRLRLFLFLILCSLSHLSKAQKTSKLEQNLSFKAQNVTLEEALFDLAAKAGVNLFYNPNTFSTEALVSIQKQEVPFKTILEELLPANIEMVELGHSLLLQKKQLNNKRNRKIQIQGKVIDQKGMALDGVLIFDVHQLNSVRSDAEGKFSLVTKLEKEQLNVSISKSYCRDTIAQFNQDDEGIVIELNCKNRDHQNLELIPSKSWKGQNIPYALVARKVQDVSIESNAKLYRKFQFSVVPSISTNHYLGGVVENSYSLNIIGGYSLGLHAIEIGGAFNIVKGHAEWLQIAGALNSVGKGFTGLQISGGVNHVNGSFRGTQISGAYNRSLDFQGTQITGGLNWSKGHFKGLQLSGGMNRSKNLHGVQIAGGINEADTLNGLQLAPVNKATHNSAIQLGVINWADTVSGKMIGLFNYAKKGGLRNFNLTASVLPQFSVQYKMGTPKLYTIYSAGATHWQSRSFWNYGFGFGFQKLTPSNRPIHYELLGSWFSDSFSEENQSFGLCQLKSIVSSKQPGKPWQFGPSLNWVFSTDSDLENIDVLPYSPFEWTDKLAFFFGFEVNFKLH